MLEQMDRDDWLGWQQYFQLCGGPGPNLDWHYRGTVLSLLYNANRGKNSEPMKPEDWFPFLNEQKPELSPQQAARQIRLSLALAAWRARGAAP